MFEHTHAHARTHAHASTDHGSNELRSEEEPRRSTTLPADKVRKRKGRKGIRTQVLGEIEMTSEIHLQVRQDV